MANPLEHHRVFRFGEFEACPASGELFKRGRRVKLQDQPFRMLVLLLERPGEVVGRDELRQNLWPENTFVEFDSGLKVALKKIRDALDDDAENPRFVETLPRRGYRFIASVSVATPAYAAIPTLPTRDAVPASHTDENAGDALRTVPVAQAPRRPRNAVWYFSLTAVAAILIALVTFAVVDRSPSAGSAQTPGATSENVPTVRRAIAIMEFRNATGHAQHAWLSTAIPEMLGTELGASGTLRVVPAEEVIRMERELGVLSDGRLARDEAVRAGRNLNVDVLVLGSLTALDSEATRRLRLDLRLQDAKTGEIVATMADTGTEAELFDLMGRVGTQVGERLGVPRVESGRGRASLPANREAAQLYAQGLARLRVLDAVGARDLLEQAVRAEPEFPLSHMALMSSWRLLGYDQNAKAEAKIAFERSTSLPRADRLRIEGRYYEVSGEIDKAIAAYRALFTLSPDSLEDGLLLAEAQQWGGKRTDSLATIDALRRLPEPLSSDPRLDMQQARVQEDVRQYLTLVRQAAEKAERQGARLLKAKAVMMECNALGTLGRYDDAAKACESALRVFAEAGSPLDNAQTVRFLGDIHTNQGRLAEGVAYHRQALKIDQASGNERGCAVSFNQLARDYEAMGDLREAEKLYRESFSLFLKVGHRFNASILAFNVGGTLLSLGRLTDAEALFERSLVLAREAGGKAAEGAAYEGLAELDFVRGNLPRARQHAETSLEHKRRSGDQFPLVAGLIRVGKIRAAQGELAAARQTLAEALKIAETIAATQVAAEARLALAQLDIEEGRPAEAEPAIRAAVDVFIKERMRDNELEARAALARDLLLLGRAADASAAIRDAEETYRKNQNQPQRLRFAIAGARVKAAQKSAKLSGDARTELVECIRTARAQGFVAIEYEARLALGEILPETDRARSKDVAALQKDASADGFQLIARKAAGFWEK